MTPEVFTSHIMNGKIIVLNRGLFRKHIQSLEGKRCELTIAEYREPKVSPLRKYYFKFVAKPIAQYTGHTKDEIHEAMKDMFASYEDDYGLKMVNSVFSNRSKYSDNDRLSFIRSVRDWALFELGITTEPYGGVE